jgi:hypothetical protein
MGRYTTYRDKPETGLESTLNFALAKQLENSQRKQTLQDTVKKALLESQLKGKRLKPNADMSKVVTGEGMLDMSQLEDYSPLDSILGGSQPRHQGSGADQVLGGGGMKFKGVTADEEGNLKYNLEPIPTEEERQTASKEKLEASPFYQQNKAKRAEDLITTMETNKVKREMLANAQESAGKVPTGFGGRMKMWWNKMFDPENPQMEDWQKVKMVLTDAQLMNTAQTKGAISDREMELFSKAAANDDVASVKAMKPVFDKLTKFIDSEEMAKKKTYSALYGEEPSIFSGQPKMQSIQPESFNGQPTKQSINFNSEQEAEAANLPSGTVVMINGRRAVIE